MDEELVKTTRRSLHKINNELSIASMALELIAMRIEQAPLEPSASEHLRDELLQSSSAALAALKRAGKTAHAALSDLHA